METAFFGESVGVDIETPDSKQVVVGVKKNTENDDLISLLAAIGGSGFQYLEKGMREIFITVENLPSIKILDLMNVLRIKKEYISAIKLPNREKILQLLQSR
jgi:hypothetical protein